MAGLGGDGETEPGQGERLAGGHIVAVESGSECEGGAGAHAGGVEAEFGFASGVGGDG